jgi:ABC-type amino acid transport system permease subunit
MSTWDILINYHEAFLSGLAVTLQLFTIVLGFGLTLGGALGWAGAHWRVPVGVPVKVICFMLSSIPLLVFLFWLHYPAQALFDVVIDPFYTAALAFSLINIFSVADIVRTALLDFPRQYLTAAKVTGLTRQQTIFRIQLPRKFSVPPSASIR